MPNYLASTSRTEFEWTNLIFDQAEHLVHPHACTCPGPDVILPFLLECFRVNFVLPLDLVRKALRLALLCVGGAYLHEGTLGSHVATWLTGTSIGTRAFRAAILHGVVLTGCMQAHGGTRMLRIHS